MQRNTLIIIIVLLLVALLYSEKKTSAPRSIVVQKGEWFSDGDDVYRTKDIDDVSGKITAENIFSDDIKIFQMGQTVGMIKKNLYFIECVNKNYFVLMKKC